MRVFQFALLCLALFIQYRLWFGHNGVQDYTRLKQAVASHQDTNAKLLKRNTVLKADIKDLKLGQEGFEERARNELGMIKPGETFIRVLPGQQYNEQ